MKPILYESSETGFASNGVGVLSDAVFCEVYRVLNGEYELTMEYPVDGIHFSQIRRRSVILAKPDPVSRLQPFRVWRITKPSRGMVTVYARHIAYDLRGIPVLPFSCEGVILAMEGLKANAAADCPFSFSTDKETGSAFSVTKPQSIWGTLGGQEGSILDTFGGEYDFDRFDVRLLGRLGADRGVSIRYGKNLTSLEQDENCEKCYTGVLPYWVDPETGAVLQLEERIVPVEGTFDYTNILTLDMTEKFEVQPTPEQLLQATRDYIRSNQIGVPDIGWTVEFVQLEKTEEYKGKALLERVLLGDTVTVIFPKLGIHAAARAVETRYDPIAERYKDIRLGSVRADISDDIVSQGKDIAKKPGKTQMQQAIDALTRSLMGATGGAARLLDTDGDHWPDTLYIADDPDPAKATKVWRYNYEGWGASENGYNGPFVMGATFDNGILADFIRAGTLNANLIRAGVLQSADGSFRLDLNSGALFVGGYATSQEVLEVSQNLELTEAELAMLKEDMLSIRAGNIALEIEIQKIQTDGVSKVVTQTGYCFDQDGLNIRKSGEEMQNLLDNTGMYVRRGQDTILQANHQGVVATDVKVNNFLILGDNSRLEDYSDGTDEHRTACFYVGGS